MGSRLFYFLFFVTLLTVVFNPSNLRASRDQLHTDKSSPLHEVHAHAHNDYLFNRRPLLDALAHKIRSVEVDISLLRGKFQVAHNGNRRAGFLEELYLQPLQERVDRLGSVYGDERVFYLWIDIKSDRAGLSKILHQTLKKYSMFTVFTDELVRPGPVIAILTGNESSKRSYVETYATRFAVRDSNQFSVDDPQADRRWQYYSLDWLAQFKWIGRGRVPAQEELDFRVQVKKIHEKGYKIRFYNTPDHAAFWRMALEAEVDFLGTDRIPQLQKYLGSISP